MYFVFSVDNTFFVNGQQLHRIMVVPASVSQLQFYWLAILYPGSSGVRARRGTKRPRATTLHRAEEGAEEDTDTACNLSLETAGEGTLDLVVKGVCLNSLFSQSKSLQLAFSKSQQYRTLFFFNLLNKLVNTLKFTFLWAVDQRCHQCLLKLVSLEFYNVYWVR